MSCAISNAIRSLNKENEIKKIEKINDKLLKTVQIQNLKNLKLNQIMKYQTLNQVIFYNISFLINQKNYISYY